jgi:hypothetical protein
MLETALAGGPAEELRGVPGEGEGAAHGQSEVPRARAGPVRGHGHRQR